MTGRAAATVVPPNTMAVPMLSVFTVSISLGVVLPLLPYLIERLLGTAGDAAQVSRTEKNAGIRGKSNLAKCQTLIPLE